MEAGHEEQCIPEVLSSFPQSNTSQPCPSMSHDHCGPCRHSGIHVYWCPVQRLSVCQHELERPSNMSTDSEVACPKGLNCLSLSLLPISKFPSFLVLSIFFNSLSLQLWIDVGHMITKLCTKLIMYNNKRQRKLHEYYCALIFYPWQLWAA